MREFRSVNGAPQMRATLSAWRGEHRIDVLDRLLALSMFSYIVWPFYLKMGSSKGGGLTPTKLLFAIWLVVALLGFLTMPRRFSEAFRSIRSNRIPLCLLVLFVFIRGMSCFVAPDHDSSFKEFFSTDLTLCFPMFVIALFTVRSWASIELCMRTFFVAAVLVALFGIIEWLAKTNPLTATLQSSDADGLMMIAMDKTRDGIYRAQSTFFHPLSFGQFLVIATSLSFYFLTERCVGVHRSTLRAAQIVFAAAVFCTNTRSSVGALLLVHLVVMLGGSRSFIARIPARQQQLAAGVIVFGTALTAIVGVVGLIVIYAIGRSATEQASSSVRWDMLQAGLPIAIDHLWLGFGEGFGSAALGFQGSNDAFTVDNMPLLLAIDSGIFAPLCLYGALGLCCIRFMSARRYAKDARARRCLALVSLALISFMLTSMISSLIQNLGLIYLLCAIGTICRYRVVNDAARERRMRTDLMARGRLPRA
ncbi:O-antigen ligase family protein [Caballeronia sp. LjRoot34]|uniref:O-antigen ligase family protein n=1 Tax=Caballeronia sp. LjRoot34 TaxID=3342325 RepID=UPI003ED00EF2